MSDWTDEEYEKILTYQADMDEAKRLNNTSSIVGDTNPIDWRTKTNNKGKNCMWPIENQGQCGSCWTFSTQASMQTNNCIMLENDLVEFST